MSLRLEAGVERWPIAGAFTISRGSKTEASVVVAELSDGARAGRGEAVPYPRYGESPEGVLAEIRAVAPEIASPAVEMVNPGIGSSGRPNSSTRAPRKRTRSACGSYVTRLAVIRQLGFLGQPFAVSTAHAL